MTALLAPAALAALAALLVPLAIHLARRSEARPTDFAAMRWLDPRPRPRSQWRVDELLLLLARLVLIALVVLWLAHPVAPQATDTTPWVAVVPGADPAAAGTGDAARRHWLAPGFPTLDTPRPAGPIAVASLLRQLDAELPPEVALSVVVPAVIDGADAERPRLSRAVAWRIAPGATTAAAAIESPPVAPLVVRFAPGREGGVRYLRAAATAWQPAGRAAMFDAAPSSIPLPQGPGDLVWLVPGPLPDAVVAWVRGGGTALIDSATALAPMTTTVEWRDADGAPLVTAASFGQGRLLHLTRRLNPAAMPEVLDAGFAERLRALFAAPPRAPSRVAAADFAPLTGGATYRPATRDLRPWLALIIAAGFLIERTLATARRGRVAV